MVWKAKAEHTEAAPRPATTPSSQFGVASLLSSPRMNITIPT